MLEQMVVDIRENAQGITCEDCPFGTLFPGGTGYCHRFVNEYTGEFLRTSARAPACDHHPRLKDLKSSIETVSEFLEDCDSHSGARSDSPPCTSSPSQSQSSSGEEEPRSEESPQEEVEDPVPLPSAG